MTIESKVPGLGALLCTAHISWTAKKGRGGRMGKTWGEGVSALGAVRVLTTNGLGTVGKRASNRGINIWQSRVAWPMAPKQWRPNGICLDF